jgi:hypothetical protein
MSGEAAAASHQSAAEDLLSLADEFKRGESMSNILKVIMLALLCSVSRWSVHRTLSFTFAMHHNSRRVTVMQWRTGQTSHSTLVL